MTTTELMGLAAHVHVLLRRKTGRVTDIEWMGVNAEYTQAVVQFAKAKAHELKDTELELWALKLELANQGRPQTHKPLMQAAVDAVRANQSQATGFASSPSWSSPKDHLSSGAFRTSAFASSRLAEEDEHPPAAMPPRYVGGIR